MNEAIKRLLTTILTGTFALVLAAGVGDVLAAETTADWRPTYDIVMRWVNFLILAFVLVKFGRKPLKEMLTGKKLEISIEIKKLEDAKAKLDAKVRETQQQLEDSSARFESIKERVIKMGERQKQEIIDNARQESQIILDSAQRKIEGRILRAKNTLRSDMVDAAVELAMQRLPEQVTAEDDRKWIEQYLNSTGVPPS
jgi:F-type H+-transporting ATPase subunit b